MWVLFFCRNKNSLTQKVFHCPIQMLAPSLEHLLKTHCLSWCQGLEPFFSRSQLANISNALLLVAHSGSKKDDIWEERSLWFSHPIAQTFVLVLICAKRNYWLVLMSSSLLGLIFILKDGGNTWNPNGGSSFVSFCDKNRLIHGF